MKCFYHPETDAVAICKNCSKGLCRECAVDVGNGIACKEKCEAEVKAIVELIERNKTVLQKTSGAYSRSAIVFALMGLLLLGTGSFVIIRGGDGGYFLLIMGLIMILGAILAHTSGKKLLQK